MRSHNLTYTRATAILVLLLCQITFAFAAPGDLDATFGGGGQVTLPLSAEPRHNYNFYPQKILVQADGKIVTAGNGILIEQRPEEKNTVFITRSNADGTPDTSFGNNGVVFINNFVTYHPYVPLLEAAVQPDGKILFQGEGLIGGSAHHYLARLNADGTRDTSFDDDGFLDLQVFRGYKKIIPQADGKILLACAAIYGSEQVFSLIRLLPNGSLDPNFGVSGEARINFSPNPNGLDLIDVALLPDGKILFGGWIGLINSEPKYYEYPLFVRVNADGTPDAGFGDNGKFIAPPLSRYNKMSQMVVQPNGKMVVVAGHSDFVNGQQYGIGKSITRYNADGSVDRRFRNRGRIFYAVPNIPPIYEIAVQPNNKILLFHNFQATAAQPNNLLIERIAGNGYPDASFGAASQAFASPGGFCTSQTVQPDGRIIVACRVPHSEGFPNYRNLRLFRFLGD